VSCDLLIACLFVGTFDQEALLEPGAAPDERDEVGALTARHRCWADSMSLNAIATPAAAIRAPW
jgi:hypothetical protein